METPGNEAQEIRPDSKNPISPAEDVFEELSGALTSDRDPFIPPEVEERDRRRQLIGQAIVVIFFIGMILAFCWWVYKEYKAGYRPPDSGNWL